MAEIVGLLPDGELRIAALEAKGAAGAGHKAGHQPQQRGFADPVGAQHHQGFAGCDRKAQAREDLAAAPEAGEIRPQKAHQKPPAARPDPGLPRDDKKNMWASRQPPTCFAFAASRTTASARHGVDKC